jgi:hypothetical protein
MTAMVAKRIIEIARGGKRNPTRLRGLDLKPFFSSPIARGNTVPRMQSKPPIPTVARAAQRPCGLLRSSTARYRHLADLHYGSGDEGSGAVGHVVSEQRLGNGLWRMGQLPHARPAVHPHQRRFRATRGELGGADRGCAARRPPKPNPEGGPRRTGRADAIVGLSSRWTRRTNALRDDVVAADSLLARDG